MLDQSFPRREPIDIGQPMEEQEKILRAGFFVPINTGVFLKYCSLYPVPVSLLSTPIAR